MDTLIKLYFRRQLKKFKSIVIRKDQYKLDLHNQVKNQMGKVYCRGTLLTQHLSDLNHNQKTFEKPKPQNPKS